jgi:transcriptional regulator with XRE-family HTH domain
MQTPYKTIAIALGQNIRRHRESAELSQQQLGAMVHLSRQAIGDYETGDCAPNAVTLWMISNALGLKPWELWM